MIRRFLKTQEDYYYKNEDNSCYGECGGVIIKTRLVEGASGNVWRS